MKVAIAVNFYGVDSCEYLSFVYNIKNKGKEDSYGFRIRSGII